MRRRKVRPRRRIGLFILLLLLAAAAGASLWCFLRPAPSGQLALVRIDFAALPGWSASDARPALAALRRSCAAVLRLAPNRPMGGSGYAGEVRDWRDVCAATGDAQSDGQSARNWFETWFAPFALRMGVEREALFTGYYEPEIDGSRTPHGQYTTPVYGLPDDLVTANLGLFRPELSPIRITGRVTDHRLDPFPTRAQIDANGLDDAPVLLYARDPISVFFLHVQGSGRARLDDGAMFRLAYAGQNGRAYTPVGRTLIAQGDLDRQHMSMQAIRGWLESHPGAARKTMESDQSYVFFRELPIGDPALGSPGSEGVPLTPETSIAVDPAIHAFGVPIFVATQAPAANPLAPPTRFAHLCIAQDTGGAIKGGLRVDIFWGFGARAESVAGRMKSTGGLYVFLPKTLAAHLSSRFLETS
ncbi:MAG TPA: MltA domain-containing protein [Rhizomicrobium sp.]